MSEWWNKVKKPVIVLGIVGILLALFLMPAFARASYEASLGEASVLGNVSTITALPKVIKDVFGNLKIAFTLNLNGYLNTLKLFGVVYLGFMLYVVYTISNKKEYENVEHGSADWCKTSEAYSILSPKQGVILADKYYFPVNPEAPTGKNGNILVIGGSGGLLIACKQMTETYEQIIDDQNDYVIEIEAGSQELQLLEKHLQDVVERLKAEIEINKIREQGKRVREGNIRMKIFPYFLQIYGVNIPCITE